MYRPRTLVRTNPVSWKRPAFPLLTLACAALLCASGLELIRSRPGLLLEYFANTSSWSGSPVRRDVAEPGLERRREVAHSLVSQGLFSLRWQGWIVVGESDRFRLTLMSDEASYLELDGERVLETGPAGGRAGSRRLLAAGVHALKIGLSQTGGESHLRLRRSTPDAGRQPLPAESLYSHRPNRLDRLVRKATGSLGPFARRLLAALLLSTGLAFAVSSLRSLLRRSFPETIRSALDRPWLSRLRRFGYRVYYPLVFAAAWLITWPLTTTTAGGDDIRYLDAAFFAKKMGWILNRYAHIDLLHGFLWLRDGDPFLASRTYWASMFAVTVVAMAFGIRGLGPKLQLRTLTVALFLLLSQTFVLRGIGAAFTDYTTMMFVTLGVALSLRSLATSERGGEPQREWHALAIGALTVAAVKSKETGIILAWLPLLFLWSEGRLDLKRFARRCAYWLAGAVAAYLTLMLLDWRFLGDFWFSLRPENLAAVRQVSLDQAGPGHPFGWLELIWPAHPTRAGQRHLWVLLTAAVLAALGRRRRMEIRLLYCTPLVFLAMMIGLHGRAVYSLSARHLIPIAGASCLLGAMFLFDSGLERISWRTLSSPRALFPLLLAATLVVLILGPYLGGELMATDLPAFMPPLLDSQAITWRGLSQQRSA